MEPVIMLFLLFSNCGFVVKGFSLRNCYLSDVKVTCSERQLRKVPTDIPPNVKSIDLSNNDISWIQVSNFKHFPNLTSLDLTQNSISVIDKRAFSQLVSLQQLTVSYNKLISLQDDVFDGLSTLIKLKVDSNQIQRVAGNAFRSLSHLLILDLSNNKLQTLAQVHLAIQHMPKLTKLLIRNNDITTFRSQDLTNSSIRIASLDLSENPLEVFEVTADVFPSLKTLNIGNPSVKSNLTWSVHDLHQVTSLDMSAVHLESIDEWRKIFLHFKSIHVLILNSMQYNTVLINMSCSIPTLKLLQTQKSNLFSIRPYFFQLCRHLVTLVLEGNYIEHIENGSFELLDHLKILRLNHNNLTSVPFEIRHLRSLVTLDLTSNGIKAISCDDFMALKNLQYLNLQNNSITTLSHCTFDGLPKLKALKLQGNLIRELGNAFQVNLPGLRVLYLNENKLTGIAKGEFSGLHSMTILSLAQNQIRTLEKGCFTGLSSLENLQLQENGLKKESLMTDCFKDLITLRKLNLDNNHIKYLDSSPLEVPPFMNLSRLETLQVSIQRAAGRGHFPSNFLHGLNNLLTFRSNNIQLLNISNNFFTQTPHLKILDIGANNLLNISPKLFIPIANLTQFRISSTQLHSLDFLITSNLTKLKTLLARKNSISVISEDIIRSMPSLVEMDVKSNSFMCVCDNSWFVQWVTNNKQTQVPGAHGIQCSYPPERTNTRLLDLNVQSCVVDIGFICFICSTCVNILILVASFTFHFSRFHLKYAYYLFLAWLYDSRNRQKRVTCHYDAFVSYNAHDEAWVYRELVPHLEQEQGWRLCLHHRDFLPGKPIVENIAEAIYGSRKTLCVISRRYLLSEWCSKEMQLASFRLFDEREDVLILVFLEDIPSSHMSPYYRMKRLLKRRSYLSWPRAAQHPQLFWEKLRQALRSTNSEEEDRLRLTVTH